MTIPNFVKGRGKLATDRYDFEAHINGSGFRQDATTIDIQNPSLIYGSPATVELALEDINSFIIAQLNAGEGFAVVGDGYDTYHNANGTINYDPAIPSLDTILNPIFNAISNGTALPTGFQRIKFGGIILIKAGTYIVKQTINVPPSITLLGEGYGTKIINATSLDFSGSPPPVPVKVAPGTEAPIFNILSDGYRSTNDAAVDPNMFIFSRETKIMNMVIADNFVEPTLLGDTYYKLPQNQTSSIAHDPPSLISQQVGSSLSLSNIMGMGRANFSSGRTVSNITGRFLGLDATTTNTETFTKLDNCFFDGFAIPIDLSSNLSADGYSQNFLDIKNCKIRAYGFYNGDNTDGYNNTVIKCNVQNVNISNSLFNGNNINISSLLYLTKPPSPNPAVQDRSKIVMVGNQVIIDKGNSDNSFNSTWVPLYLSSLITSPNNVLTSLIYGNSFQDSFDIWVDAGTGFTAPGLGTPNISIVGDLITMTSATAVAINAECNLNGVVNISKLATIQGASSGLTIEAAAALVVSNTATTNIEASSGSSIVMDSGSIISMKANSTFDGYAGSTLNLDGYVLFNTHTASSDYICDTSATHASDFFIFANVSGGAVSIYLPLATASNIGRVIIVKDTGSAASNPLQIIPQGGQTIDGSGGSQLIAVNFGFITVVSMGTTWGILASKLS